jgi:hypothetical protein
MLRGLGCPAISSRKCPGSRLRSGWRWHWRGSSSWWAYGRSGGGRGRGRRALGAEAVAGALAVPAVCFLSRLAAQSCKAEKRERLGRGGGGDRERQERGAILTVLMPFSPERAHPPSAHSFARRADSEPQRPPAAPALRTGRGARRVGSSAGLPPRPGRRLDRRPRRNGDRPDPALASTARRLIAQQLRPRGLGRPTYPHSPSDRAALSHPLEMRDPQPWLAPRSRIPGGALNWRGVQGVFSESSVRDGWARRRALSLHRNSPHPRIPSRWRARKAGALDIRGERRGSNARCLPARASRMEKANTAHLLLSFHETSFPSTLPHVPWTTLRYHHHFITKKESQRSPRPHG